MRQMRTRSIGVIVFAVVAMLSTRSQAQVRLPIPVTDQNPLPVRGSVEVTNQTPLPVRGSVEVTNQTPLPVRGTVEVVNQNPLPVRGRVEVLGPVSVTAQQPLEVEIIGTLHQNPVPVAFNGILTAKVSTDTGSILAVRDVEDPARNTYQHTEELTWQKGEENTSFALSIPFGKRLVVEQLSFNANAGGGDGQIVYVQIQGKATQIGNGTNNTGVFFLPGIDLKRGNFLGGAPVRLYADFDTNPATLTRIFAVRSGVGQLGSVIVSVVGHLIDL